ncbi:MAG: hypothetical protein AAFP97_01035 [Pseudomonadota bacterium]
MALLTWGVIYPVITALLWVGEDRIAHFAMPVRTLILTGLLVPLMSYVLMPAFTAMFEGWLGSEVE